MTLPKSLTSVFRSPKFDSENKTLLYILSLQGWKTDCLRFMLETSKSKQGLCLQYSTLFLSLDFSSSLLGDPSLLPKRSLPHSSRIADYMLLHAKKQTNTIKEGERLLKNVVRKIRGTQREYSSKALKHSIVKRILVFKQ